jgi:LysR family glycine cleavage system transcriptional activator
LIEIGMRPYLPLNGLRAFEAAARHLSFKKAAEELHVTPAAVGHQVKRLEDNLGVALFRRLNRALQLTPAAEASLADIEEGFDKLSAAVDRLRTRETKQVLTATVAPSFAAKWLIPRLDRFRADHPGVSVRMDTSLTELDLEREGIDVGIRFGDGHYPGLRIDRFMDECLIPVCSPALSNGDTPIHSPGDLKRHSLLHIEGDTSDRSFSGWSDWLKAANCTEVASTPGPRFTQSIMAVQAAIEGQGVALAPNSIVADDLQAGRLVRLFQDLAGTRTNYGWYIVSPVSLADREIVKAFRKWIISEARGNVVPSS